jgi:hypothetical protein
VDFISSAENADCTDLGCFGAAGVPNVVLIWMIFADKQIDMFILAVIAVQAYLLVALNTAILVHPDFHQREDVHENSKWHQEASQ